MPPFVVMLDIKTLKNKLDTIYNHYNKREFVHPDPLEFLYNYKKVEDREIVALVASSLAYGRVQAILKAVESILVKLTPSPHSFILNNNIEQYKDIFNGFKYRFTDADDICALLLGIKRIILDYGSLRDCFEKTILPSDDTIIPSLSKFFRTLKKASEKELKFLLPLPENGSACKRANLFLRWMIRKDRVDPGGWNKNFSSKLVIPLDTHMYKISSRLGFTSRKNPNLKTAIEITNAFKKICPNDPVKYDFALTRPGIRNENFTLLK